MSFSQLKELKSTARIFSDSLPFNCEGNKMQWSSISNNVWIMWSVRVSYSFGSDILLKRLLFILLKGQHQNLLSLSSEIKTDLKSLPEFSQMKAVVDEKIILKNLNNSWLLGNGSQAGGLPYLVYKGKCLEGLRSTCIIGANVDME